MSKITDLQSLSAAVPSEATIAVGGFQLNRVPVALLEAIVTAGRVGLCCVSAPNPLALQILAAGRCLRAAECGFVGFQYEEGFVIAPAVRDALAAGTLQLRQPDVYDTIQALRTAAKSGEPRADFALLHAQRADRAGNLQIDDPYVDVQIAAAARRVLATVEEVVDTLDTTTIPAASVEHIAVVPAGASPTACLGHYPRDAAGIGARLDESSGAADPSRPTTGSAQPTASVDEAATDAFIVNMARQVRDGEVIVTGLASASQMLAIELARRTHAPDLTYINCIGAVNPRIDAAYPTSVESRLRNDCERIVELPDLFDLARDGGVDTMFFGAAQVDAHGNINLSHIGPADNPKVRLAGPAGSPSMRSWVRRVLITVPRQMARNLVEQVDTATSAPADRNVETVLITDAAIWRLEPDGFEPASLHAGVTLEGLSSRTGFEFAGKSPSDTPPPNDSELEALRSIDPDGLRHRLLATKV